MVTPALILLQPSFCSPPPPVSQLRPKDELPLDRVSFAFQNLDQSCLDSRKDANVMEIVQKCQNPRTSAEEQGPYRSLAQDSNPMPSSQPDLNASQEMQWSLAKEDCTCSDLSLNRQDFLIPPQDLGWDLSRSPPPDTGLLCEEMTSQDDPELLEKAERLSDEFKEPERWPCQKTPYEEGLVFQKTRLPSIVVEPSEGKSGELLWPPEDFPLMEGAEQEEFLAEEEEEEELEAGFASFESDVEELLVYNPKLASLTCDRRDKPTFF